MAYWWVSQNRTYKQERAGGYLWAPKSGENGVVFRHWSNMTLVRPGDVIFSYADQSIGAVGIASSAAYDSPQPTEFKEQWQQDGYRVDMSYQPINPAVRVATFVDSLIAFLPDQHSPLTKNKTGVQGYLFAIPPKAGSLFVKSWPLRRRLTNWLRMRSNVRSQTKQHDKRWSKRASGRGGGAKTFCSSGLGSVRSQGLR